MPKPSKYKASYCAELIKFFDVPPYVRTADGLEPNDLPTFQAFAKKIGIHRSTLADWREAHPEFEFAWEMAKYCQHEVLLQNGLRQLYPGAFAIFAAKNVLGWRDSKDLEEQKKADDEPLDKNTQDDVTRVLRIANERK